MTMASRTQNPAKFERCVKEVKRKGGAGNAYAVCQARVMGKGKGKRNPESGAESMYESFHGRPSTETLEFVEDERYTEDVATLGVLVELRVKTVTGIDRSIGFETGDEERAKNPMWPFGPGQPLGSRTTVTHMRSGVKTHTATVHKGYGIYKRGDGGFTVPQIDRESVFDTKKDAQRFIDDEVKYRRNGKPGPISSAAHFAGDVTGLNQVSGFVGRATGALDKRLGKAIGFSGNPPQQRYTAAHLHGYSESDYERSAESGYNLKGKTAEIFRGHPATILKKSGKRSLVRVDHYGTPVYGWMDTDDLLTASVFEKRFGYPPETRGKSNPGSNVAIMSGADINKALDRLDKQDSKLTQEFIDAGRGHERAWDIMKMSDPLALRYRALYDQRMELKHEMERRYGPGVPSRLPKGFGPIKRNPEPVSTSTTLLTANRDGSQLYFVGGDQSLDLDALKFTDKEQAKESIVIGDVYEISYLTQKDFDSFETIIYQHEFSEDTGGPLPTLRYDRLNKKLFLDGGSYYVNQPLLETSPGIED